jgi:hypothetical protein
MRSPRIKQYNDGEFIEKERTHKDFLSRGFLLHGSVVGMARSLRLAPLLALLLVGH